MAYRNAATDWTDAEWDLYRATVLRLRKELQDTFGFLGYTFKFAGTIGGGWATLFVLDSKGCQIGKLLYKCENSEVNFSHSKDYGASMGMFEHKIFHYINFYKETGGKILDWENVAREAAEYHQSVIDGIDAKRAEKASFVVRIRFDATRGKWVPDLPSKRRGYTIQTCLNKMVAKRIYAARGEEKPQWIP